MTNETRGAAGTPAGDTSTGEGDVEVVLTPDLGTVSGPGGLLVGVGLLMLGTGLLGSLLGVQSSAAGFRTTVAGVVLAAYYGGYLIGSAVVPRLIRRVGHIRVFTALASIASAVTLVHAVFVEPVTWFALRLTAGACMAGLFVVAESWLNGLAEPGRRGHELAVYMLVTMAGLGGGQLLLNVSGDVFDLVVLSSVLVSLAVVPVSLTRAVPPAVVHAPTVSLWRLGHQVPLGVVGAGCSGLVTGALLGFGAVFGHRAGLSVAQISVLLAAPVAVAAAVQLPLGRLSDRVERRTVIAVVCLVAGAGALGATLLGETPGYGLLVACTAVVGGLGVALYPLSVAHVNDYLDPSDMVGAGSRLVMVNGLGAVTGPVAAGLLMARWGPEAFFWPPLAATASVGSYALWRQLRRERPEVTATYLALPSTVATPVVQQGAQTEVVFEETGEVPRITS